MSNTFTASNLQKISHHPFLAGFDYQRQLPSTNDYALRIATDNHYPLPLCILTEQQTAGRGRGSNRWWSEKGALTFSLLLSTVEHNFLKQHPGLVALLTGLTVCETLETILLKEYTLGLKWPNDLFVNGRKICGILTEVPPSRFEKMVIGIGINVNNSLAAAPPEIQAVATSLCDLTAGQHSPTDVLLAVLDRFEARWKLFTEETDLSLPWQRYCLLSGRTIEIESGSRQVKGLCRGIDAEGALLLETDNGVEQVFSGAVKAG